MKITNRGFSLLELIIVVAIISILAAVAIPNFEKFRRASLTAEAKSTLVAIHTAQKAFYAEHTTYTPCLADSGFKQDGDIRRFRTGFSSAGVGGPFPNDSFSGLPCNADIGLDAGGFATVANTRFPDAPTLPDDIMMPEALTIGGDFFVAGALSGSMTLYAATDRDELLITTFARALAEVLVNEAVASRIPSCPRGVPAMNTSLFPVLTIDDKRILGSILPGGWVCKN